MLMQTAPSPIVTIYADHGQLVTEIADAIRARGAATHTVSIETGWVASVSRALLMLDSPAGLSAARALCDVDDPFAHVVALLTHESGAEAEDLSDRCVQRHGLVAMRAENDDVVAQVADEIVGTHRV
jgi:hypothetical protein